VPAGSNAFSRQCRLWPPRPRSRAGGLGLLAAGGDSTALAAAAVLTWAFARARLPPPEPAGILPGLTRAGAGARVALGAAAGAITAWQVWLLWRPPLGFDGLTYHLPEAIGWVASGRPGTVLPLLHGIPVGHYPRTHELLVGWAMGLSRSFAPVMLLEGGLWVLLMLATWLATWAPGSLTRRWSGGSRGSGLAQRQAPHGDVAQYAGRAGG